MEYTKAKMKRNTSEKKDGNKRYVTFSKRRKGLFRKAAEYCLMFGAQAAILVMSEAGGHYGFGHSSVDRVLNRYLQGDIAPDNQDSIALEEPKRKRNKQKREYNAGIEDDKEHDYKVEDVKELIAKKPEECRTVEEMVALRDKCLVLQEYIDKRVKRSHLLGDGSAQCVSIKPIPKFEDFWVNASKSNAQCVSIEPRSTSKEVSLNIESEFHVGNNNDSEGCLWEQGLVDNKVEGVSRQMLKVDNIIVTHTHEVDLDDHYDGGTMNDGEGSFQDEDLIESKAQHVSVQPSLESEDVLCNSTLSLQDHITFNQSNNINGGEGSSWNENLMDISAQPSSKWEDVLYNSTLSLKDHIAFNQSDNINGGEESYWNEDLVQHFSAQLSSKCEDVLYNSTLSFMNDHHCLFGDNQRNIIDGSQGSVWYEDFIDGKVKHVPAQPSSVSEDVWSNSTSDSENNYHYAFADHQGTNNSNGWEGSMLSNTSWSRSAFDDYQGNNIDGYERFSWNSAKQQRNPKASLPTPTFNCEVVDGDHPGKNINGGEGSNKDLENIGAAITSVSNYTMQ